MDEPKNSQAGVKVEAVARINEMLDRLEALTVSENPKAKVEGGDGEATREKVLSGVAASPSLESAVKPEGLKATSASTTPKAPASESYSFQASSDEKPNEAEAPSPLVPAKHSQLVEVSEPVTVERVDQASPLVSAKTWNDLNLSPELMKGIHAKGFAKPSRIQGEALPLILNSETNLIAQAQNGSGKTATFALAMLSKVSQEIKYPQSLCLCHTRELARQNLEVIKELGKFTGITSWVVVPQGPAYDRERGAQIVVGTPGKTGEVLQKRVLNTKFIKLFVLDEADVMVDHSSNLAPQVRKIRASLGSCQVLLFSATFPQKVADFCSAFVPNANKIRVEKEKLTLTNIQQSYILCSSAAQKRQILSELYMSMVVGQSIIFVNSKKTAQDVAHTMVEEGHPVTLMTGTDAANGQMTIEMREAVMAEFKSGVTRVLVATDVLSRGIDVPQVNLVVNFDLPVDYNTYQVSPETYIHRVGRAGRYGRQGLAISLIVPHEMQRIQELMDYYRCEIFQLDPDPEEIEKIVKRLRE